MTFPRHLSACARLLSLSLICLFMLPLIAPPTTLADDGDWQPLDPQALALKKPVVDPEADAEALFWEVRLDDASRDFVLSHYVRTKIFTERGRESQSKIELPYGKIFGQNIKLKDIEARTITPDGTIIPLKKEDIFDRTEIKTSGIKWKVKSFALPGVVPGAIIEYRWREVRENSWANYSRLEFQRDIPIQRVTYFIKPNANVPFGMRYQPFRIKDPKLTKEKNGFHSLTQTNVPAFRDEARMPPESAVRSWALIYYTPDLKLAPQQFWRTHGRLVHEANKKNMKVDDEVRRKATEIVGDAATPDEKLARLLAFCRAEIKNIHGDTYGAQIENRADIKENKSPADTLKRGTGTSRDIDLLFAALASALGYDARVAVLGDRSDSIFDPNFADDYFLRTYSIAVRTGDGATWRFFDPCSTYVSGGMLPWQMEGQMALVSDNKDPQFVQTPVSAAQKSIERRTAKLRLTEDGTLEGDVRVEYGGHPGAMRKEQMDDEAPADRENLLRAEIRGQMSTAEISDVRIENATDPVKPFILSYRVRVPAYAQRTGKRLFLQPAFFQKDRAPLFATNTRVHPIYFDYGWAEEDTVTIDLPVGFTLDNADMPQPIDAGAISKYAANAGVTQNNQLVYKRTFHFGNDQLLQFETQAYPQLKRLFDAVHENDKHTIALKAAQ